MSETRPHQPMQFFSSRRDQFALLSALYIVPAIFEQRDPLVE